MSARSFESTLTFRRNKATLAEIFKVALRANRLKIRTAIPATVINYVAATQKATVQLDILTKRYSATGSIVDKPYQITVPVRIYRTILGFIYLPINPGDKGHVIISDRSIQKWLTNGGLPEAPGLLHTHNPVDGIFEPGLHPDDKALTGAVLANDALMLEYTLIKLGASASEAAVLGTTFLALYNDLVTKFNNHTHVTTATVDAGPVGSLAPPVSQADPMVAGTHTSLKVQVE